MQDHKAFTAAVRASNAWAHEKWLNEENKYDQPQKQTTDYFREPPFDSESHNDGGITIELEDRNPKITPET